MGNCAFKSKKKPSVQSPDERPGISNLRINRVINCPKCTMSFPVGTPFIIVNSHIESCLITDDSAVNNSNYFIHENPSQPNNLIISGGTARSGNSKYIWIKKIDAHGKATWEKTVSTSTKTVDHLENMSVESAKELDFEDKKKWFKFQNDKIRIPWVIGADHLNLSHKNIVETALKNMKKMHLHKEVKIVFEEERNVNDAGGLLREFVYLLCQETFKEEANLFSKTHTEEVMYTINPKSSLSPRNLELYHLIGKVMGKAIFEQISLPVQFDHLLLKQLIQTKFTLDDLATLDKQLYNSLVFLRDNPIDDDVIFEEYFTVVNPMDNEEVELIPNGRETRICDDNKSEYIQLILEWLGKKSIEPKVKSLLDGIYHVVPKDFFQIFDIQEVEMLLYGLPFIDVNDWEGTTTYKGSYYKNHQIVKWFWEVMKELNQEQLSKFFYFCTGSTRPPVEGFSALQSNRGETQKFTIESIKYDKDNASLKAHTCFNRLELPMYTNKETVEEAVQVVLNMDFRGVFGLE